jgi:hypothetical protein
VDTLHKDEFLGTVEQEKSYYSFDRGGFHFVVLDSCFRSDGQPHGRKNFQGTDANIPAAVAQRQPMVAQPCKAGRAVGQIENVGVGGHFACPDFLASVPTKSIAR